MVTFNDYVDTILAFFDHLPTFTWTFVTLTVDKIDIFWTTYPPLLVHVVIECPPGAGHGRGYDEHHPAERNVQKYNFIQISFSETKKMCVSLFFISFLAEACPRGWKEKPYLCYE